MDSRLPPLKSLEGFDAAARLGSFAAAADELGLSHSAISHQIRALERALDQDLFRRVYRQVVLTDAGRDFHRTVRQMLKALRDGVDRLAPYRKPNSVILYCDHAFADGWLMPRLSDLIAKLPQVDLWLDSRGSTVDPGRT
ncbi:MAG: LysR family transcriptional regulator, partial [Pseudomonadota bacterium]|nr:LysR family transcriptional regulator [Pseudomonadota bacterium]